jgi:hypothetical protein
MDTPVLLAILGAQLLMIGGLFKLWWDHIRDCRARAAKDAVMRSDNETGIRGAMHKLRQDLSPFAVWCQLEMAKRERQ